MANNQAASMAKQGGPNAPVGPDYQDLLEADSEIYLHLRRAFKRGVQDEPVRSNAEFLKARLGEHRGYYKQHFEYEYYHCLCLIAEIFERFGRNDLALETLQIESETITRVAVLKDSSRIDNLAERRILREKVRLVLDWADSNFYRHHLYTQALELARHCERMVKKDICVAHKLPCYGTLAQIYRLKGKIYRQQRRFMEAEQSFGKAIINYYLRAQHRMKRTGREIDALASKPDQAEAEQERKKLQAKQDDDQRLVVRRVAMIMSQGFGWIAYQQGFLQRAHYSYLIPARFQLLDSEDKIVKGYNRLVTCSVLRSMEDSEGWRVSKALSEAREAEQYFRSCDHQRFILRARFEQGHCHLRLNEYERVEELAESIRAYAEQVRDDRWLCNAYLLQARVAKDLGDPKQALEIALKAETKAGQHVGARIEALFLLVEIKLVLHRGSDARADLQAIAKITDGETIHNPLLDARFHFLLAKAYLAEKEFYLAEQAYEAGRLRSEIIEHFFIKQLETEIKEEFERSRQIFTIKITEDSPLDFQTYRPQLLEFLIKQAQLRSKSKTKSDVAQQLGISRQTLLQWEQEIAKTRLESKQ